MKATLYQLWRQLVCVSVALTLVVHLGCIPARQLPKPPVPEVYTSKMMVVTKQMMPAVRIKGLPRGKLSGGAKTGGAFMASCVKPLEGCNGAGGDPISGCIIGFYLTFCLFFSTIGCIGGIFSSPTERSVRRTEAQFGQNGGAATIDQRFQQAVIAAANDRGIEAIAGERQLPEPPKPKPSVAAASEPVYSPEPAAELPPPPADLADLHDQGIDTVLELHLREIALSGKGYSKDTPVTFSMTLDVRLFNSADGLLVSKDTLVFEDETMKIKEWQADNFQPFIDSVVKGEKWLLERLFTTIVKPAGSKPAPAAAGPATILPSPDTE